MSSLGRRWRWAASPIALLVALLPACHTHRLVESGVPDAGSSVTVQLADSATRARAEWWGVDRDRLSGTVVRADRDTIVLSVPSRLGDRPPHPRFRDTLSVPGTLVTAVREERLSAWRSAVLTAGLVAGGFLLLELKVVGGGRGVQPPNGDGVESRAGWPKRPPE